MYNLISHRNYFIAIPWSYLFLGHGILMNMHESAISKRIIGGVKSSFCLPKRLPQVFPNHTFSHNFSVPGRAHDCRKSLEDLEGTCKVMPHSQLS